MSGYFQDVASAVSIGIFLITVVTWMNILSA